MTDAHTHLTPTPLTRTRLAHTAELDAHTRAAAKALLQDAFAGDMSEEDWDHALGGMHALVWEGAELIGHASVVQRRMLHAGRSLRCGYVEGVGVRADRRRRGHGAAMMTALEQVIHNAYDLGALSASADAVPFYTARGWQLWQGPSAVLSPTGLQHTKDEDGAIYVLQGNTPLNLKDQLACDWRDGDVW
ncbi:aminoglycoside 2'-N-acetyltransferase [Streptomyces sp. CB02923]|uniref:GNAT family N-acetyltransferase n=1 Tax=Streptomyces sp. CB02923 TaxID=1718985 RepID=UPI00093CCA13|nr:GNAT family N-acetyltransferase [Streptomyces sp. CB02923]OKI08048.1 aminoglycoside 2'-N-acetyltransferase [Streptomyces sp. CB02923]